MLGLRRASGPGSGAVVCRRARRIANPPQIANLPHRWAVAENHRARRRLEDVVVQLSHSGIISYNLLRMHRRARAAGVCVGAGDALLE